MLNPTTMQTIGLLFAAVIAFNPGCGSRRTERTRGSTGHRSEAVANPSARERSVAIPEGSLLVGSIPGTPGRDSALEADRIATTIPSFEVDYLPYPGQGAPRVAVTRAEAAAICETDGKRLCNELEWERACAGDGSATYATGAQFSAAACRAGSCESPLGVADLGISRGEWTASTVSRGPDGRAMAVVRGAAGGSATEHRCAARHLVPAGSVDPSIAFRCCGGSVPELAYPTEPSAPPIVPFEAETDVLRRALASVPELSDYASDFRLFRREEQQDVIARGANATPPVVVSEARIARGPLRWTPSPADTVVVFAGRSGTTTIVAVLYPLSDGGYAHAASLVMPNDSSVAVITTRESEPRTLGFSTCLGCGGEDGEIRRRDDGSFVVVTR